MLRTPQLTSQCLACQVPLAGPLAWPARAMGIRRSIPNPNLCSRCGNHLAAGEIRPVALVLLELEPQLSFGSVALEELSQRELPALQQQIRSRLEDQGGLVLPAEQEHPLRLQCYFNAPVIVEQPERHAFAAVRGALRWLEHELQGLGLQSRWRSVVCSGFVEIVPCEGPLQCFPMGEVTFRAAEMLERTPFEQLVCDRSSLNALLQQDPEQLQALGVQQEPLQPSLQPSDVVVLLRSDQAVKPVGGAGAVKLTRLAEPVSTVSQIGALLLALIAAPCAAMVVFAPSAVVIGLGSVMAALLPFWKVVGMSIWPRVLITLAAVLVAALNLLRAELAQKRFRQLQRQVGDQLRLPMAQRRRLRAIRWSSWMVLAIVFVEGILRVMVMKMPLL